MTPTPTSRATDPANSEGRKSRSPSLGFREFIAWMAFVYALGMVAYLLTYAGFFG